MDYNFQIQAGIDSLGEPYDIESVMHYGESAFSKNGQKTIEKLPGTQGTIRRREDLSPIDVRQLRKLYNCGKCIKKLSITTVLVNIIHLFTAI